MADKAVIQPVNPPFVKVFAAPGIDSHPDEVGVYASGAGRDAGSFKVAPYDWLNESPEQGYATGNLIADNMATKAKPINSISIRRRGVSPWGGFFPGKQASIIYQHPGGIADMNPGASSTIAGGPGAASSFVRLHGVRGNRGMKLPTLPQEVTRGGNQPFPAGGGSHEPLTAPLIPKVPGWPSIFKVSIAATPAKKG
jgi:hypothetical protein